MVGWMDLLFQGPAVFGVHRQTPQVSQVCQNVAVESGLDQDPPLPPLWCRR